MNNFGNDLWKRDFSGKILLPMGSGNIVDKLLSAACAIGMFFVTMYVFRLFLGI